MAAFIEESRQRLLERGFADITEVQAYLKLSKATVYNLMESGALDYAHFGRRRRVPWESVYAYANQNLVVR